MRRHQLIIVNERKLRGCLFEARDWDIIGFTTKCNTISSISNAINIITTMFIHTCGAWLERGWTEEWYYRGPPPTLIDNDCQCKIMYTAINKVQLILEYNNIKILVQAKLLIRIIHFSNAIQYNNYFQNTNTTHIIFRTMIFTQNWDIWMEKRGRQKMNFARVWDHNCHLYAYTSE